MDILLHNNNQLLKKLSKIEKQYRDYEDCDGDSHEETQFEYLQLQDVEEDSPDLRRRILQFPLSMEIAPALADSLKNTADILRYLHQSDGCPDEIEAAKEECVQTVLSRFGRTDIQIIITFMQVYINLLSCKYSKIEI